MFIPPSELIINPDNSIYHLKLRPDEIADTIITVGDPARVDMVAKHLDEVYLERHSREFKTITGRLGKKDLTIISTGIGTDNIDIVFNELDALANIDFETRLVREQHRQLSFIRIGTSGAISEDIPLNSFIASKYALGFDGLLNYYKSETVHIAELEQQVKGKFAPYAVACDTELLGQFESFTRAGLTLTADGFYGPQGRNLRLEHTFDINQLTSEVSYDGLSPTNLEMETAGIYGLAKLLGHKAISLNAILANRITNEFSTDPQTTVELLIKRTLELI